MSSEWAIRVENLGKSYQLYDLPRDRLKQFILPPLQRAIGITQKEYYRAFWALKDVSFEVKRGEALAIMGNNGSGKSTLLQLICGTINASSGNIRTNGRVAALLELGTGFNPEFTGRENVYLNGAVLGLAKDEIDARFDAIAGFADIGEFINQPIKTYSSGMVVRLAFAVMANIDAAILLIDEALAVGDIHFSQKCMRYLQQFRRKGTLLLVSHNSNAIADLCDHAIWLDKGRVQAIGETMQVIEKYLAHRYGAPLRKARGEAASDRSALPYAADRDARDGVAGYDMRMPFINRTNLRNDLQLHDFAPDTRGFGHGGVRIVSARFLDSEGRTLSWVVGGERISIEVVAELQTQCSNLIIGFQFKNAYGQALFAQNTFLPGYSPAVGADPGEKARACFSFRMPILPMGTYAIDIAIADGMPPEAVQLLWLHEALVIESHASSAVSGLIGIPFEEIRLERVPCDD